MLYFIIALKCQILGGRSVLDNDKGRMISALGRVHPVDTQLLPPKGLALCKRSAPDLSMQLLFEVMLARCGFQRLIVPSSHRSREYDRI